MNLRALLLSLLLWAAAGPLMAQTAAPTEYQVGAGDLLRVSVYQNPDLLLEARVSEAGQLSYPLLGSVKLGGLGVSAAERLIAEGLRSGGFVAQPQVNITVLQVRAHLVNVLGQVQRPGRYALESAGMRLSDLLAIAGGSTSLAGDTVVVTGSRGGKAFRSELELPSLFAASHRVQDPVLMGGDVIWVDRAPQVYIYGEVQRPGALRLERGMSLMQALAAGGGTTPRGTEKGIRLHRRGDDGRVQVSTPGLEELLRGGDVVFVRESLF